MPDEELFWHCRTSISPYLEATPLVDPRAPTVRPEMHQYLVGDLIFIESNYSRQRYARDRVMRRRHDDVDHLGFQVYLSGSNCVSNGGRDYEETPGGVFVVNLGYDVEAVSTDAHVLTLIVPRTLIDERLPRLRDARGLLFSADQMGGRIFGDFMMSLRYRLPQASAEDGPMLSATLIGLLEGLIGADDPAARDGRTGAFLALQRHIEGNLGDLDLGADSLCARFRLSRATLFRIFKPHGGVQRYIQRRRLMACFRALCSRGGMHRPIYDVALDCGLTNPGYLSSLFRQHFGLSPSDVRDAARYRLKEGRPVEPGVGDSALSDVERMQKWARELGAPALSADRRQTPVTAGAQAS